MKVSEEIREWAEHVGSDTARGWARDVEQMENENAELRGILDANKKLLPEHTRNYHSAIAREHKTT